ncbi:uncharacterized protein LOC143243109 isoform X1 [Tachypleus tridentatus]|uniref:uncharacterized protein LOC143243109 isoform X1 n=2 Tax=Tachypleus tridentatus TaxID=6853 RepID=UPI003FD181AA
MSLELVAYAVCVGVVSFTKAILLSSMNFIRFLPLEFELRHPKVFDLMFLGSYCTLDVDIYYCEHCAVSMYPHPIKSSFPDEVTGGVLSKVKRKLGLLEVSKMIFS